MNMLKMCMNWKVIAGLAVLAAGVFVFASPTAAAAALPFLLAALCPLSMVLMMRSMGTRNKDAQGAAATPVRGDQSACCSASTSLSRDEQVAALQQQLNDIRARQTILNAQLVELTAPERVIDASPITAVKPSH